MPNQLNRRNGKTDVVPATALTIAAYATGAPPVISFRCKDVRSINDVKLTCTLGYTAVPVLRTRNTITLRIYKTNIHYFAQVGAVAVTVGAGGNRVLEAVGGPFAADLATTTPVEIPDGAIALTINGLAIGTK